MKLTGGNKALQTWWKDAKSYMRQYREGNLSDKWTFKQWRYNQGGPEDPRWRAVDFNPRYKEKHISDHLPEFPGLSDKEYVENARKILNSQIGGVIEGFIDKSGEVYRYNTETNEFAKARKNGIIKTYYKPTSPTYWERQKGKNS